MIDFELVRSALAATRLHDNAAFWINQSRQILENRPHGDRAKWLGAIAALPAIPVARTVLDQDAVTVDSDRTLSPEETALLQQGMMQLHPWRKGPFQMFDMEIDAEWRSCDKWNRLSPQLSPLDGRLVLDVGCGNGYYLLRMLGAGARLAMGIDPTQLFLAQFCAINSYAGADAAFILPMRSEEFAFAQGYQPDNGFDTVFSMGIYYHRRDPLAHLQELHGMLRPGGELVFETLVLRGDADEELVPKNRYAQMRNVWSIPTVPRLSRQLTETGFCHVRQVDLTATTVREQRVTRWMRFASLENFLQPGDPLKTVEGYPAPLRACMIATRAF